MTLKSELGRHRQTDRQTDNQSRMANLLGVSKVQMKVVIGGRDQLQVKIPESVDLQLKSKSRF